MYQLRSVIVMMMLHSRNITSIFSCRIYRLQVFLIDEAGEQFVPENKTKIEAECEASLSDQDLERRQWLLLSKQVLIQTTRN